MLPKSNYLTENSGQEIIGRLKSDPSFWYEFVKMPKAVMIFNAKMRSCNIPKDRYDDLVMETYCHLYPDNWAKLDGISEPNKFWGWFGTVVNYHFGFNKDEKTGEYVPKKALRELLPNGTTVRAVDIAEHFGDDESHATTQIADPRPMETDILWNDYRRQFLSVLAKMKASSRKGFPLYAEVIERIALRHEERVEIAVDLVRRGLLKGPVKDSIDSYTHEELVRLRDNLNNNIFRRGRVFFDEIVLQNQYECNI